MKTKYTFSAKIWLWKGDAPAAWHFITVPKEISAEIKQVMTAPGKNGKKPLRRGWGSVKVEAKIGKTTWTTSIFPATMAGGYLLPVKLSVRQAEGLYMEQVVKVALNLIKL
ncbi:MAG: hypothetical protein RI911_496 [Candidatus Parcubacteria bacterium]|jgi:hypothetical protein